MRTSQCAVYQVKETPEYRDVRFRSYEKLRSEGKSVSIENYQQVYIGRIQPDHIRIPFQKWNNIVDGFHRIISVAFIKHCGH